MRYFKLLENYFPVSSFQIQEQIYPEDYKLGCLTVEVYVTNTNYFGKGHYWKEVSEKEYWQQELDNGKLVQGSYYTIKESGVIFKYDGTEHSYYYLGWSTDSSGVDNFYRDNGRFTLKTKNYRLATDEEIKWLEACNRADKFISKEEFMGSKKFKLPEMWSVEVTSDEQFHIVRKYITKHINERFDLNLHREYYPFKTHKVYYIGLTKRDIFYNSYYKPQEHGELITFGQFKEYVLQIDNNKMEDKFAIIVTNNNSKEIVNYLVNKGYKNTIDYEGNAVNSSYYVIKKDEIVNCFTSFNFNKDCPIYTLEELKSKLDNKMKEKRIIGYKLVKPEYHSVVKKITGFNFDFVNLKDENNGKDYISVFKGSTCYSSLKEAGVLDLWFEPVFFSDLPKVLGYDGKIENDYIKYGCKRYPKKNLKQLLHYLEDFDINFISINEGTISVESLKSIVKVC